MKLNHKAILIGSQLALLISTLLASKAQAALPTAASEVNPIEVGTTAPDVLLNQSNGTQIHLHELVAKQPAILVFYRGGWCPYCNRHLAELSEIEQELNDLGYRIHAVSADKLEKVAAAASEPGINYSLYSDATTENAQAFGLAFQVDAKTNKKLLSHEIDIEAASGQQHHLLPVPAVFIIDDDAKVRFRYYNPNYKERLSGEALLNAARSAAE